MYNNNRNNNSKNSNENEFSSQNWFSTKYR